MDRNKVLKYGVKALDSLYFFLIIFYLEVVTALHSFGFLGFRGVLYTFVFSAALGLVLRGIAELFPGRGKYIFSLAVIAVITFIFGVQQVYYTIFRTYTVISSVLHAGEAIGDFWRETISGIGKTVVPILLGLIPLVLFVVFGRKLPKKGEGSRLKTAFFLAVGLAVQLVAMVGVGVDDSGIISFRFCYYDAFSPELTAPRFGVMTTLGLDIKNTVVPEKEPDPIIPDTPAEPDAPETPDVPELPEEPDVPQEPPEPVYVPNVLEIDFNTLIENETDPTVKEMHEFFANREPTMQNEYTGFFEGKNLIWIVAEGFSSLALDETHTPTITKMAGEGFVFQNYYNPIWGVSTSDGEYTTLTGTLPKANVWSFARSGKNYMPYGFGSVFTELGYSARAYHNHTYTYYDRHESHPNLGYDYKGIGNGLEMKNGWPRSDVEMMEKTVDEYIGDEKFHTYYMTVSGHLEYNFMGNNMCYKHRGDVQDMLDAGYSEAAASYIACQMEFDQAVQYLIDRLDEAGKLSDTVIVISGDHYPYGLEHSQMEELYGGEIDKAFELYRSTLIIWNSDMDTVQVPKYCSAIDVMPTLLNLFGVEYDSRLIIGRDILSDSEPIVVFNDRSFITNKGRYYSGTDKFTPSTDEELPENYARDTMGTVKAMFTMSARILEKDYYAKVLK